MRGTPAIKDSAHAQGESIAMCKVRGIHCPLANNVRTELLGNILVHFKWFLQDKCIWVKDSDVVAPVCQEHDGHHTDKEGCLQRLKIHFSIQSLQTHLAMIVMEIYEIHEEM